MLRAGDIHNNGLCGLSIRKRKKVHTQKDLLTTENCMQFHVAMSHVRRCTKKKNAHGSRIRVEKYDLLFAVLCTVETPIHVGWAEIL
ncbi:hypothetical protein BC937DRAFT_89597 [Endogone sp. FLAS-F59071]|nr:hypothetical protein BC937DRAFT_89597 [Endogone sp. FLAS-F59071]|eukprot:RUS17705.1 hypothetical protein BC937DRAFT_89597 [Endogone sp. FLAS-F59071]